MADGGLCDLNLIEAVLRLPRSVGRLRLEAATDLAQIGVV